MLQRVPESELLDDNGTRIISPTLHHTGNFTARKEEMMQWYRSVLGQQPGVTSEPPGVPWEITWTTNDWAHHRMGFGAMPGVGLEVDPSSPGVGHVAWEYGSIDDLLESWQRIRELGIEPQFCVSHLITYAFYYRDPDGNLVELLADAFEDHDRSAAAFFSDERAMKNPAGSPVDPQKLIAARRAGVSVDDMRERSYAGEYAPDDPEAGRTHDFTEDQTDEGWRESGRR